MSWYQWALLISPSLPGAAGPRENFEAVGPEENLGFLDEFDGSQGPLNLHVLQCDLLAFGTTIFDTNLIMLLPEKVFGTQLKIAM